MTDPPLVLFGPVTALERSLQKPAFVWADPQGPAVQPEQLGKKRNKRLPGREARCACLNLETCAPLQRKVLRTHKEDIQADLKFSKALGCRAKHRNQLCFYTSTGNHPKVKLGSHCIHGNLGENSTPGPHHEAGESAAQKTRKRDTGN